MSATLRPLIAAAGCVAQLMLLGKVDVPGHVVRLSGRAGAGGGPTYLISEDWEGDNTGTWSVQNTPSAVNMDSTTNVLEGFESLACTGQFNPPPYVYNTILFSAADCHEFFLVKVVEAPTANDYAREIGWIVDAANNHLVTLEIYRQSVGAYKLRVTSGTAGNASTVATFNVGDTLAVWVRYQQGSGSNARADLWWTPWTTAGDAVKPLDGSAWHAHRDDGNYATAAQRVQLGAILRAGQGTSVVFDHVRVDDAAIGDNPE